MASVSRRPESIAKLLRHAWLDEVQDAELMSRDDLKDELANRGVPDDPEDDDSIETLLPVLDESDTRWRVRRAATEVLYEPALRFLRIGQVMMPATLPRGDGTTSTLLQSELVDSPAFAATLAGVNAIPAIDPNDERFGEIADRGRIGLVVTQLEIPDRPDDRTPVSAESTLWVLQANGGWVRDVSRKSIRVSVAGRDTPNTRKVLDSPIAAGIATLESVASQPPSAELSRERLESGLTMQDADFGEEGRAGRAPARREEGRKLLDDLTPLLRFGTLFQRPLVCEPPAGGCPREA